MADGTSIEWTDATWQPITGCSIVSKGCTNCYAMKLAGTRLRHHPSRAGLTRDTKAGPVWTGEVRFNEEWLDQPLRWRRPRRIFVCAHGDLFAEGVPDEWIDRVFAVMALCPHHTFQVLTKRPERMRAYFKGLAWGWRVMEAKKSLDPKHRPGRGGSLSTAGGALRNVWLGVSAEDQATADERVPILLETPAAVRFVSAEPLLGPIDFRSIADDSLDDLSGARRALDWIIVGGESGPDARPMHPDWVRSIRDQCQAAAVAFLFKQWGAWLPGEANRGQFDPVPMHAYRRCDDHTYEWPGGRHEVCNFDSHPDRWSGDWHAQRVGKAAAGRLLDGREWSEFPS